MTRTHYKSLIESDWLGQWDLVSKDGQRLEPTVIIHDVEPYRPAMRRKKRASDGRMVDEKFNKLAITLKASKGILNKKWIAGAVSQAALSSMFGPYIEDWKGKKIKLWVDPDVTMGRKKTGGVRVRNTAPTDAPTDEPLDNAPDPATAERIADAFDDDEQPGRQPGEEG